MAKSTHEPVAIDKQELTRQETMKNLKSECEKDREKVKGIFRFYECPGGTLCFPFRKYKWDQVENYSLTDGETYEIPLGVAKHLNDDGWYPEHHYLMDEGGKPHMRVNQKKHRFGFQSLDFMSNIGESKAEEIVTAQPLTAQPIK